ncbi:RNA recognition motif domain - like 10 [Theobroma cacao]|nr:RNA recognition motif domain - like 10 [Theobroma cacao]
MQTRTVQVKNLSDLASEREIHEFFSFSGDIERIEIIGEPGQSKIAYVTFKDPKALEIALLLSGATIVDKIVVITCAENYLPKPEIHEARTADNTVSITPAEQSAPDAEVPNYLRIMMSKIYFAYKLLPRWLNMGKMWEKYIDMNCHAFDNPGIGKEKKKRKNFVLEPVAIYLLQQGRTSPPGSGRMYVSKAQDVVASMLAKGSAIRQDAVNKAKAFDEKHRLTASASAKVTSFDRRVGLTEKLTVGISVVNEKVKSVDQRLQVSDKTMAAIFAAERKINDTGSAVKSSRYVTAGTAWLNGAFSKVAKAGQVAGTKTREKFNMAMSNLTAKDPIAVVIAPIEFLFKTPS